MDVHVDDASGGMSFGVVIRERRESMGLTQKELAAVVGNCSARTISQYEKGKCPTEVETYFNLAETLRLTPNDLSPRNLLDNAASGMSDYARLNSNNQRIVDQLINGVLKIQNEATEGSGESVDSVADNEMDSNDESITGDEANSDGETETISDRNTGGKDSETDSMGVET